uniref:Lipocalin/cytosolic fatty-acid binding domain-containing protein n=1 Tax=Clastoptera arizonana TaxID=38151 RepID=A0A1B6CB15_9HEMI
MLSALVFAFLIVGAYSKGYEQVGVCKELDYEDEFDFSKLPNKQYLVSVADVPGSEYVDGVVINTVTDKSDVFTIQATADIHTIDGKRQSQKYTNTILNGGAIEERYTDENGVDMSFYMIVLGEVPECNAVIYYRCSFEGTNSKDVINVIKNDRKPISDACASKIKTIVGGKTIDVAPTRTLPYNLKNYD